jgi:hypothetical protein
MEGFKSRTATALQNIVTNIYSKTAMSAADVTLVNMSPIPVLKILTDYGHPNEVATQLVRMTSEVVAIEMAIQWMEWAVEQRDPAGGQDQTAQAQLCRGYGRIPERGARGAGRSLRRGSQAFGPPPEYLQRHEDGP